MFSLTHIRRLIWTVTGLFCVVCLSARSRTDTISLLTISVIDSITGDTVSFRMRRVDHGTFLMGATPEQRTDKDGTDSPVHSVSLSSYYIAETEVTQRLWKAVTGYSHSPGGYNPEAPQTWVSWHEATVFAQRLTLLTGYAFSLPTEAQWEYAARGGGLMRDTRYAGTDNAEECGWIYSNSGNRAHEVNGKRPNELGLYDMTGNVSEWCSDWLGPYELGVSPDPQGPATDSLGQPVGLSDYWSAEKVVRGGSWDNARANANLSCRGHHALDFVSNDCGLRLAMSDPFAEALAENEKKMRTDRRLKTGRKILKLIYVPAEEPFFISEEPVTENDWVAVFGKDNEENIRQSKNPVQGVSRSRQVFFCEKVRRRSDDSEFFFNGRYMVLAVATDEQLSAAEYRGLKLKLQSNAPETDRAGSASTRKRKRARNVSVLAELVGVKVEVPEDKVLEMLVEDKRNTRPFYLVLK